MKDSRVTWQTRTHTHTHTHTHTPVHTQSDKQERDRGQVDRKEKDKQVARQQMANGVHEKETDVRGADTFSNMLDNIKYHYRQKLYGRGGRTYGARIYVFLLFAFLLGI